MIGRLLADLLRGKPSLEDTGLDVYREHADNPLARYFQGNRGRLIHKWHHYFEIYHRHFAQFRGRAPVVVEIGVSQGGSLQMWHDYFGPGTQMVGIDIDARCKQFADESTTIMIGDQADPVFLAGVRERVPHVDILIDDGGHTMAQQIVTFEALYSHIQPNGIYLCEDIHTSFFFEWEGGFRREGTFHEYSKALTDRLYAWHSREPERFKVDALTLSTFAIHFYNSILVIEKRPMSAPENSMTGVPSF